MEQLDRKALKARALEIRKGAKPHAALVTLVYVLLTTGISAVVEYIAGTNVDYQSMMIAMQYGDPYAAANVLGNITVIGIFLTVLVTLYCVVMELGYYNYALQLSRGEEAGIGTLISGFGIAGKAILTNILTAIYIFLWYLAFLLPAYIIMVLLFFAAAAMASTVLLVVAAVVSIALVVLAVVLWIRKILDYSLVSFTLLDDPDAGAAAAIRASKELMRGHRGFYFVMLLSFIGWGLLSVITLGIVGLWVTPYVTITEANFYNAVRSPAQPQTREFPTPDPF